MHFGEQDVLIVCRLGTHAVANAIEETWLQEAVEERFETDADAVLAVVGEAAEVAVVIGIVDRGLEIQPIKKQVVAFTVGNEASDGAAVGRRGAVIAKITFGQDGQALDVAAGDKSEE